MKGKLSTSVWERLAQQGQSKACSTLLAGRSLMPDSHPELLVFPTQTHTIKTNYIVTILICCTILMLSIPLPNIDGDSKRGSSHTAGFGPGPLRLQPTPSNIERGWTSNPAFHQLGEAASQASTRCYPQQPSQHLWVETSLLRPP